MLVCMICCVFFFKQKTAYEMRISDWSSDVCSSDLNLRPRSRRRHPLERSGAGHRLAGRRAAAVGQGHARAAAGGRRGRPAAGVRALRILLLGANGQVGTELQRSLAPLGEVVAATRNGLLASGSSCEVADFDRPEALQPLIARTAPDGVEIGRAWRGERGC